ncbi:MAG: hypothetical protein WD030_08220 [Pirellulales bacterium]
MKTAICCSLVLAVSFCTTTASAATLKGRFVYDGKAPAPAKLAITKDTEVCSEHAPVDESLVVGPDGGIQNILIWVRTKIESPAPEGKPALDNLHCRFDPHVLIVHTGQTLELKNSDPVGHNSNITTVMNPATNQSIPPNGSVDTKFTKEERLPAKVSCGIHPWMTAWVLVVDDTYNAVTKEDGSFEISGLPEGEELEFQVWQEKGGYTDQITCEKFPDGWSRGRFKMTFSGDVDLGEIKVSPDEFK